MKLPWQSDSSSSAGTATLPDPATDLATTDITALVRRRDELNARLAAGEREIGELKAARSKQLLAGENVSGALGISAQLEERDALSAAIATLGQRIQTLQLEEAAVAARALRVQQEREFAEAVEAAIAARAEMHAALKMFVLTTFPRLLDASDAASERAREAGARIGHSYGLSRYYGPVVATIGFAIARLRWTAPALFEPERPPADAGADSRAIDAENIRRANEK